MLQLPLSTPPSGTPPLITIPLPTPSPPLLLPSTDCRSGVSKVTLPPRKRVHVHPLLDLLEFATMVRHDTYEIYGRLDDAQDDRLLMSGRLNMLHRDRHAHAHTVLLMEREARLSREAYGRLMDASNIAHSEVRAMRTTVLA
ncbi:hypothetical protein Tco_0137664 [Tanacetum coccineum]